MSKYSKSEVWAGTLDIAKRPDWLKQLALAPEVAPTSTGHKYAASVTKVHPNPTTESTD